MGPVAVVVLDVLVDDSFEMSTTEDEHPVQAFTPDGTNEALGEGVCSGARIGVRMVRMPSERNTSSKLVVNLVSRSRIRNLTGCARWASSQDRLLACWATQAPVGCAVTPVTYARRVSSSMKNRT